MLKLRLFGFYDFVHHGINFPIKIKKQLPFLATRSQKSQHLPADPSLIGQIPLEISKLLNFPNFEKMAKKLSKKEAIQNRA